MLPGPPLRSTWMRKIQTTGTISFARPSKRELRRRPYPQHGGRVPVRAHGPAQLPRQAEGHHAVVVQALGGGVAEARARDLVAERFQFADQFGDVGERHLSLLN